MTTVPLNDLSRLDASDVAELSRLAIDVISSGHFLGGAHTAELLSNVSARTGQRPVIGVGNGTDALYVGLAAMGVGPGTRVATISNAGGYTTGTVLRLGGEPVMVDCDAMTAQMSLQALHKVLSTAKVDVVVLTHLYGLAVGVQDLVDACRTHGASVLEDCAQAFGSITEGKPVGTFGDVATFSFYPTKNLGALGDAGAVAFRDPEVEHRGRLLAQYGWGRRYVVTNEGGFNSRIDEIQAAFLNHRIKSLDSDNRRRREIVLRYQSVCKGGRHMIHANGPDFIGHLAVMVTSRRQEDESHFQACGVSTGIHYPVLDHQQPAWFARLSDSKTPNAEVLVNQILTLPCFPAMTEEEVQTVVNAVATLD